LPECTGVTRALSPQIAALEQVLIEAGLQRGLDCVGANRSARRVERRHSRTLAGSHRRVAVTALGRAGISSPSAFIEYFEVDGISVRPGASVGEVDALYRRHIERWRARLRVNFIGDSRDGQDLSRTFLCAIPETATLACPRWRRDGRRWHERVQRRCVRSGQAAASLRGIEES